MINYDKFRLTYQAYIVRIATGLWNNKALNYMDTAHKMKFSINDFFSKFDQILRKLRTWSHLPKKSLIENFIFCAVGTVIIQTIKVNKMADIMSIKSTFLHKKYERKPFTGLSKPTTPLLLVLEPARRVRLLLYR